MTSACFQRIFSALPKLTSLDLTNNQIIDISPLSGITTLTSLILNNNQILNISALSSLSHLIKLDVQNNKITDISPLSTLSNPFELFISGNCITDVSALPTTITIDGAVRRMQLVNAFQKGLIQLVGEAKNLKRQTRLIF